jgi:hypothetical protein
MAEPCSVRELELRIIELEIARVGIERDIAHHREMGITERTSTKEALEIATKSTDAHLLLLNGEAGRLRQMQETYLPREVYSAEIKELRKDIGELREFKSNMLGRQAILTVVVSSSISLIFFVINTFLKK